MGFSCAGVVALDEDDAAGFAGCAAGFGGAAAFAGAVVVDVVLLRLPDMVGGE